MQYWKRNISGAAILSGLLMQVVPQAAASPMAADPVFEAEQKAIASDGIDGDYFGWSVAVDGDTAVIGGYGDDDNGSMSGSAYVFIRIGGVWKQQAKLTPSDGKSKDYFGWSVSVDGDTAVIGAYAQDNNNSDSDYDCGAAYIFTRSGGVWRQEAKLAAGGRATHFGYAVSLSGDTALIGTQVPSGEKGIAYVFSRSASGWSQEAMLTPEPEDREVNDHFGFAVSLDGDSALIGAYGMDSSKGVAYIFSRDETGWSQQTKLIASDRNNSDEFGYAVAVEGDTARIAAPYDDDNGSGSGSVYIFADSGSGWSRQTKLTASDAAAGDQFGYTVSLSGDTALIGAPTNDDNGTDSGSAYVFSYSGTVWKQQTKLIASDTAQQDQFGHAVSLDGDTALIGAPHADGHDNGSGAVYFFGPKNAVVTPVIMYLLN